MSPEEAIPYQALLLRAAHRRDEMTCILSLAASSTLGHGVSPAPGWSPAIGGLDSFLVDLLAPEDSDSYTVRQAKGDVLRKVVEATEEGFRAHPRCQNEHRLLGAHGWAREVSIRVPSAADTAVAGEEPPVMTSEAGSKRLILYLDVDGVLLGGADSTGQDGLGLGVALARHAKEFLAYCTGHYDCRWLTTKCRDGDAGPLFRHLSGYAGEDLLRLAASVKPTTWNTLKTEAIDPLSDFYWVDDSLLQSEQQWLATHGILDRWIQADTRKRPDDLGRVLEELRQRHAR
ncbi:MAG: hypothetical protein JXA87_06980 [Thermoleophilia bacterium]|nr:hypothetical protein [Thermoleophilia bacterium]